MRALAALLVLCVTAPLHAELKVGAAAPALGGLVDEAGKPVTPPAWAGQVVVLTFGASWCGPCKKELPALDALAVSFAKRNLPVTFAAVNFDSKLKTGAKFFAGLKLVKIRPFFDPETKITKAFDPKKMPTTFVVTNGSVAHVHGGYEKGDDAKLLRVINAELATLK